MESEFLHHAPCPECGSKDNAAVYSDGHSYCFGCGHVESGDIVNTTPNIEKNKTFVEFDIVPLAKRNLDTTTLNKFNYGVAEYNGRPVQVANYYNAEHQLVAQKLRYPDKSFQWIGEAKDSGLFGQQLWRDKGKKNNNNRG